MPEVTEGQPEAPAAAPAGATPAVPAFDPTAFEAKIASLLDQRIAGVQSSYQKQLNERDEEIRTLKTASLSEDEREQLAEQEGQEYLENLERQVWLATEASKKYPKASAHIQKLFEANGDVASFAEYLESALNPTPPAPEPAEIVPEVDSNNPPRNAVAGPNDLVLNGQVLTAEMQKQILDGFGNASLAEIRGRG